MDVLQKILNHSEDWLITRVLEYAEIHSYTKYASPAFEAWRISIRELSKALSTALEKYTDIPELNADFDYTKDFITSFGIQEAKKHRQREIPLSMFLGLIKYYRQSYLDLINESQFPGSQTQKYRLFVNRCFDRIEIGITTEWVELEKHEKI